MFNKNKSTKIPTFPPQPNSLLHQFLFNGAFFVKKTHQKFAPKLTPVDFVLLLSPAPGSNFALLELFLPKTGRLEILTEEKW